MFPTEIWEKILKNVEATTLARLCTVNSTWNIIIKKHLQESNAWYRQCKQDIPEKYWLILLENSFHLFKLHQQENLNYANEQYNCKIWLTMYKAWMKWCNVQNFSIHTVNEFKPIPAHRPSERITCCAVLGELVAIGSSEGYVRIFNLRTNKLVFRIDQYEQVQDVKLCVQGKNYEKIILIVTSISNISRFWDITSQKNLMLRSGSVICAGYGYYCTALHYNKLFVYNANTETGFLIRLFLKDAHRCRIPYDDNYSMKLVNMIINKNQICFWSNNGYYCELDLWEINNKTQILYTPDMTYVGVPRNERVCRYYLFNPYVAFCITDRGYLGISVHKSKWQIYNVFPFLEGIVTAVLFYVRVLIIGLDSGDICIFFIENELALKTIDFKSKKSKRIHIGSEPIVSVNVMEISGDQTLLIATKSTVYHIRFDTVAY